MTGYSNEMMEFDLADMVKITRRLSELLDNDLQQLEGMRISKLHDTHDEKLRLAMLLEGYKNALKANPGILKTLSQDALIEARAEAKQFETKLGESHTQLRKAHTAHNAVLELIRSVVRDHTSPIRSYGKDGHYRSPVKDHVHTLPINLDERI